MTSLCGCGPAPCVISLRAGWSVRAAAWPPSSQWVIFILFDLFRVFCVFSGSSRAFSHFDDDICFFLSSYLKHRVWYSILSLFNQELFLSHWFSANKQSKVSLSFSNISGTFIKRKINSSSGSFMLVDAFWRWFLYVAEKLLESEENVSGTFFYFYICLKFWAF